VGGLSNRQRNINHAHDRDSRASTGDRVMSIRGGRPGGRDLHEHAYTMRPCQSSWLHQLNQTLKGQDDVSLMRLMVRGGTVNIRWNPWNVGYTDMGQQPVLVTDALTSPTVFNLFRIIKSGERWQRRDWMTRRSSC